MTENVEMKFTLQRRRRGADQRTRDAGVGTDGREERSNLTDINIPRDSMHRVTHGAIALNEFTMSHWLSKWTIWGQFIARPMDESELWEYLANLGGTVYSRCGLQTRPSRVLSPVYVLLPASLSCFVLIWPAPAAEVWIDGLNSAALWWSGVAINSLYCSFV